MLSSSLRSVLDLYRGIAKGRKKILNLILIIPDTKKTIKDFFCTCVQIRKKLRFGYIYWKENSILCIVIVVEFSENSIKKFDVILLKISIIPLKRRRKWNVHDTSDSLWASYAFNLHPASS